MRKNLNIQGLRAFFALVVFMGHSLSALKTSWVEDYAHYPVSILYDGSISVIFFFVLSGYFYYNTQEYSPKKHLRLAIKRLKKLLPPYWIMLTIGAWICFTYQVNGISHSTAATSWFSEFWRNDITWGKYIHDFLIIHRGYPIPEDIIPPSWYLEVDIKMMILVPFLIFILNRLGWKWCWALIIPYLSDMSVFPSSVPFVIGACAHHLQDYGYTLRWNTRHRIIAITLAVCLMDIWNQPLYDFPSQGMAHKWITMCQYIGAGLLISMIATMKDIPLLSNKYVAGFGNISYEFYISHFVVLLALEPFFTNPYIFTAVSLALSVTISIGLKKGLTR